MNVFRWYSGSFVIGLSMTICCGVAAAVSAHPSAIPFERLTTTEGLSQNTVTSILQDSRGFLWFGTEGGLNRYDGYEFKVFNPVPGDPKSLSGTQIWSLFEDRGGDLWIGTDQGLFRLDSDRNAIEDPIDGIAGAAELGHRMVTCLLEDRRGDLWIGTRSAGLFRLQRGSRDSASGGRRDRLEKFRVQVGDTSVFGDPHVRCLYEDEDGGLWVGFNRMGLAFIDSNRGEVRHFPPHPEGPGGLSFGSVTSILQDREGAGSRAHGFRGLQPVGRPWGHRQRSPDSRLFD